MHEVSGDFEIHITCHSGQADRLASFAAAHGLTFVHILLDRGAYVSQPMITLTGRGSRNAQQSLLRRWHRELGAAGLHPCRSKIEVAPRSHGVPASDRAAVAEPPGRYFEHHVKLLLPSATVVELIRVTELVAPHGARLSRNARRERADGVQERFVNQRCHRVGLDTARQRLDALVDSLGSAGYEIGEVEQEYVVHDDAAEHDLGWLEPMTPGASSGVGGNRTGLAAAGSPDYPPTYRPLTADGVRQRAAFDPALKQYPNAYRAGEPEFVSAEAGAGWKTGRRAAMNHLLEVIASTSWADHLVLRGSVTMAAWVGDAAREPGDLDFVVTPPTLTSDSRQARTMLRDLRTALRAAPGAGLQPDRITETAIWTYERADGRRLAVPFRSPGGSGDVRPGGQARPEGHVQVDVVFGEPLPLPPETLVVPGVDVPLWAAPASLSLAWKLLWLATDRYPQGKDLYDAALLAEHTTVGRALVRHLLRPELGPEADAFGPESVLAWDVDWTNFTDEYPAVRGTAEEWTRRLAVALDRAWG